MARVRFWSTKSWWKVETNTIWYVVCTCMYIYHVSLIHFGVITHWNVLFCCTQLTMSTTSALYKAWTLLWGTLWIDQALASGWSLGLERVEKQVWVGFGYQINFEYGSGTGPHKTWPEKTSITGEVIHWQKSFKLVGIYWNTKFSMATELFSILVTQRALNGPILSLRLASTTADLPYTQKVFISTNFLPFLLVEVANFKSS